MINLFKKGNQIANANKKETQGLESQIFMMYIIYFSWSSVNKLIFGKWVKEMKALFLYLIYDDEKSLNQARKIKNDQSSAIP